MCLFWGRGNIQDLTFSLILLSTSGTQMQTTVPCALPFGKFMSEGVLATDPVDLKVELVIVDLSDGVNNLDSWVFFNFFCLYLIFIPNLLLPSEMTPEQKLNAKCIQSYI